MALIVVAVVAVVAVVVGSMGLVGCSSATNAADLKVGDCLQVGGTADRPEATKVVCGSPQSNFKVVATAADSDRCPTDVDSSYSMRNAFSSSSSTACLNIDWVIGGCMSVDPDHNADPVRIDCHDVSATHRQRATQILRGPKSSVSVDQCASGLGYAYDEQRFTVCVEDVG